MGSSGGGGVGSLGGGVGSFGGGVGSFGGGGVGSLGGGVGSFGGGGVGSLGGGDGGAGSSSVWGGSGDFGIFTVTSSSGKFSTFGMSSRIISVIDFLGPGKVTLTGWTGAGADGFRSNLSDSFLGGGTTDSVATAAFAGRGGGGFSLASARSTHLDSYNVRDAISGKLTKIWD